MKEHTDNTMNNALLDELQTMISVYDGSGNIVYLNKAMKEALGKIGISVTDGLNIKSISWDTAGDKMLRTFKEVIETGNNNESEVLMPVGKELRWFRHTVIPFRPGGAERAYALAISEDITKQKEYERQLKEREEMFAASFYYSPIMKLTTEFPSGHIVEVNPVFLKTLGYDRESLSGKSSADIDLWADPAEKQRFIEKITKNRKVSLEEITLKTSKGAVLTVLWSAELIEVGGRKVLFSSGMDITKRKEAERSSEENRKNYTTLVNTIQDVIAVVNDKGRILIVNDAVRSRYGISPEKGKEHFLADLFGPKQAEKMIKNIRNTVELGASQRFKEPYNALGREIWLDTTLTPIEYGENKEKAVLVISKDITSEVEAENRYSLLFNGMQEGFALHEIVCDDKGKPADYRFLLVNPAFEKITGLKAETITGKRIREIMPDIEDYWIQFYGNIALNGKSGKIENYSGSLKKHFEVSAFSPRKGQFAVLFTDISDRKEYSDSISELNRCFLSFEADPVKNIEKLLKVGGGILGADYVLYNIIEKGVIRTLSAWNMDASRIKPDNAEGHICNDVTRNSSTEPVVIRGLEKSAYWTTDPGVKPLGIKTYVGQAVDRMDGSKGTLCFLYKRDVEVTANKLKIVGILASALNSEERRQGSITRLLENEKKYRMLFENAPVGILTVDREGRITEVNEATARLLASPSIEATKAVNIMTFPLLIKAGISDAVKYCFSTGNDVSKEFDYTSKWGKQVFVIVSLKAVKNPEGDVYGVQMILQDITQRKNYEDEIKRQEDKYKTLVEEIDDIIYEVDKNGLITYMSPAVEKVSGFKPSEVLGRNFTEFIVEEDIPGLVMSFRETLKGIREPYQFRVNTARKKIIWLESMSQPFIREGKPVGLRGTLKDITSKKLSELALRESEEKYRQLLENINIGVALVDKDRNLIKYNTYLAKLCGISAKEQEGAKCHAEIMCKNEKCDFCGGNEAMLTGKWNECEAESTLKHGKKRILLNRYFPIYGTDGKSTSFVHLIEDITERKKSEQEKEQVRMQAMQSEKMASVGILASGIAHEFNNLMQIVRGNAEIGGESGTAADKSESFLNIIEASDRASKIVENLLTFSGKELRKTGINELSDIVESVYWLTRKQLEKDNISFVRKYEKKMFINVNKHEIQQIFLNIMLNARDAMGGKPGQIRVSMERDGKNALVTFSDDGSGMDEEQLKRIFDPFYSTKNPLSGGTMQGFGLGLYVSYWLAHKNGGNITVKSEKGKGTVFTVAFPETEPPSESDSVRGGRAQDEARHGKGSRILIVDDEKAICQFLRKYFVNKGYAAATASKRKEITEAARNGKYDLAIIDINLEGITAVEVINKVKTHSPGAAFAVISGNRLNDFIKKELEKEGITDFLMKPFQLREIDKLANKLTQGAKERHGKKESL